MTLSLRRIIIVIVALVLGVGILVAALNVQRIRDTITVMQYAPSAEIDAIVTRTDLSDDGRFLLFTGTPTIIDTQEFNARCSSGDGEGAFTVLGCYSDGAIYTYRVADERLDGIMDVTTVHEMLHAAWDRLSPSERARITVLLDAEVDTRADDTALAERLDWYDSSEPGNRATELHSIVGTEFRDISPELEEYYARYFTDRDAVLGLFTGYRAVFDQLQASSAALTAELDELYDSIEAATARYESQRTAINADIDDFNQRADDGDFDSQAEFDSERAALLARNAKVSAQYTAIQKDRDRYAELQKQLEAVNAESEALSRSLDSTLAPPGPMD